MKKWLFTYEKGSLIMKKWYGFWFCVFDLTFANSELEQYPKTNPHKLIIWFCGFFAHAFIVLLSILTAVRLFQIILLWWWFISWFQLVSSHYTLQVSIKAAIMMAKSKLQPASVALVCFLGCLHVKEQAGLSFPLPSKLMASLEGSCFVLLMESHLDLPMLWI